MRLGNRRPACRGSIRGAHDRGCGQLADGDVIRMAVGAVRAEGNDDVRLHASKMCAMRHRFGRVDRVERAVRIAEQPRLRLTPSFARPPSTRPLAPCRRSPAPATRRVSEASALAARRRQQEGRDAFGGIFASVPPGSQRLIVGMRQDAHQPKFRRERHDYLHAETSRMRPRPSSPVRVIFPRSLEWTGRAIRGGHGIIRIGISHEHTQTVPDDRADRGCGRGRRRVPARRRPGRAGAPPATPGAPPTFGTGRCPARRVGRHIRRSGEARAGDDERRPSARWRRRAGGARWRRCSSGASAREGRARRPTSRRRRGGIRCSRGETRGPARDGSCAAPRDAAPLPASDADIAYAPVTQLSRWIETEGAHLRAADEIYLRSHRAVRSEAPLRHHAARGTRALARARQADAEIAAGRYRGPLHGIPYGVKDLLDTAGIPTTYGAEPFRNRVPARPTRPWCAA